MSQTFTKEQTVARALEIRALGKSWSQIASELADAGYRNRSGSSYTEGGIHTLVSFSRPDVAPRKASIELIKNKNQTTSVKKQLANREEAVIELGKTILSLTGVDAEAKLKMIKQVFQLQSLEG